MRLGQLWRSLRWCQKTTSTTAILWTSSTPWQSQPSWGCWGGQPPSTGTPSPSHSLPQPVWLVRLPQCYRWTPSLTGMPSTASITSRTRHWRKGLWIARNVFKPREFLMEKDSSSTVPKEPIWTQSWSRVFSSPNARGNCTATVSTCPSSQTSPKCTVTLCSWFVWC